MKKYLLSILVAFASFIGLIAGVSAEEAPATFQTQDVIKLTEYVPGIAQYYKPISGGLEVFCEDAGLTYVTGITYKLKGQVHDGYIYIFEHRPNTGDKYKDYYIQSIAVWWFKDYLAGNNNNIPAKYKTYITEHASTDTVCKLIVELVEGAKKYKQEKGTISLDSKTVTWLVAGDYYVSSKITVSGTSLTSGSISLKNAPANSKLINSTVDKTGNGTFQIQIPRSSITPGQNYTFSLEAVGKYKTKKMYDYYLEKNPNYQYEFQTVIYGKVFSTTHEVTAKRDVSIIINTNKLIVNKIDKETNKPLAGAGLTLYKGNCVNGTCINVYSAWTSGTTGKEFIDIPVGEYTLVETSTPNGYLTAEKQLVKITSNSGTYNVTMVDAKAHNKIVIHKVDQQNNSVIGAGLVLYKGNCVNTTCTSKYATWTSTSVAREFYDIPVGVYTLVEETTPTGYRTAAKMLINITSNNQVFTYKMVDTKVVSVRISKTDVTGQKEIPGATLVLQNEQGKQISKWVSTSTPHYEVLEPGIYTLTETIAPQGYILNKTSITFKVDIDGNIYQKSTMNTWIKVDYIKMVNETRPSVNISKLDSESNEYVLGAVLRIKNSKGEIVATWTTSNASYYVSLEEGTYILEEVSAPQGYVLNNKPIYFKVDANANVFLVDSKGNYTNKVNGIIMYNEPEKIVVPATGLTSTLTYTLGTLILGFGAIMLYRNEKQC